MILSGGGARGAYEVGVLSYIFDDLTRMRGAPPRIDILCGTSVGAINALLPRGAPRRSGARPAPPRRTVERARADARARLRRAAGHDACRASLSAAAATARPLRRAPDGGARPARDQLARRGALPAPRHAARAHASRRTEVSTGRTVVFMQTSPDVAMPAHPPPRTLFRADHIGPHHALASAAIPLLFPPVRIDDELYLDGGLRQNTPIAPALRLGATHIFAIGSSREVQRHASYARTARRSYARPGRGVPARQGAERVPPRPRRRRHRAPHAINDVIDDGTRAYGDGFLEAINGAGAATRRAGVPSTCNCLRVRPSEDIGRLASEHVRRGRFAATRS